jgi:membrane protein
MSLSIFLRNLRLFMRRVGERMRQERLSQTAAGLTFTTTLGLVPLATVALAIFTAFPLFKQFRLALQDYFLEALMPASIANTVMQFINGFADKARGMTLLGLAFLVITALAMLFTMERTLNQIWQVRPNKGLAQRMVVAWAVVTLGPVLLGVSLWLTGLATAKVAGYKTLAGATDMLSWLIPIVLAAAGWAVVYRTVPHTRVQWRHAVIGALAAALLFELAKRGFAAYLTSFGNFRQLYGAFAVVPIFLLWLYLCWLITLAGAVIAALLPTWGIVQQQRVTRTGDAFADSLAVVRALHAVRHHAPYTLTQQQLETQLKLPAIAVGDALNHLQKISWVAALAQEEGVCYSLIVEPEAVEMRPLVRATLIDATQPLPQIARLPVDTLEQMRLDQLLNS